MPPRKRGGSNKPVGKIIRYEDGSSYNKATGKVTRSPSKSRERGARK